jgi:ketosteroid isomerase-like protein
MRKLLAALSFLILAAIAGCDQPSDVATTEAVDNAAAELDEAFAAQDAAAIKARVTPDHVAVTYYSRKPQTVDEQIASLPELKYTQTDASEPKVVLLGPDVAMRTLITKFDGTFKGRPLSGDVFETSIMVKQRGKWLERFYQVTRIAPQG